MKGRSEPIFLESQLVIEAGEWVVYLEFMTERGMERKRIGAYRSEKKARVAARWMSWAARREIGFPTGL